jgi:hypothetical protein
MAKAAGADPAVRAQISLPERPATPPPSSTPEIPREILLREEEEESEPTTEDDTQLVHIDGSEQEEEDPAVAIIDLTSESDQESATPVGLTTPRKRSSGELHEELSREQELAYDEAPYKRARTGERYAPGERVEPNPYRVRKRSSEELPDEEYDASAVDDEAEDRRGYTKKQRVQMSASGKLNAGDAARGPLAAPRSVASLTAQENDRSGKHGRKHTSAAVPVDGGAQ